MKEKVVSTFGELHDVCRRLDDWRWAFRGLEIADYRLLPKVARLKRRYSRDLEMKILDRFRREAVAFLSSRPQNKWEWLAVGQHHGLPTRLMDWTSNPLVAAFFAVEKESREDAVIFAHFVETRVNIIKERSPFEITEIKRYRPNHVTRRLAVQAGLFSAHADPERPLETLAGQRLVRIVIRAKCKLTIKKNLATYGIHRGALFPDLDGLADPSVPI